VNSEVHLRYLHDSDVTPIKRIHVFKS